MVSSESGREERDVSRLAYFGLFALQHRGQESAGIAVSDGGRLTVLREMGLVAHAFDEQQLQALPGEAAIGHTRYSTTGANKLVERPAADPPWQCEDVALGHNGNLVNVEEFRSELVEDGIRLASGSDTEIIAALITRDPAPLATRSPRDGRLEGAYSVTALVDDTLVAFRDPLGFRPLILGQIGEDWVVASETCALDLIGADACARSVPARSSGSTRRGTTRRRRCPPGERALHLRARVFRATRLALGGVEVHGARVRMGERLAREAPAEADLVIGIADAGRLPRSGSRRPPGSPTTRR